MLKNNKIKKFYNKNGYYILNDFLSNQEIKKISNKLNYLKLIQKKVRRGLSEPGVDTSLLYNLHKDKLLKKIIEENKNYKKILRNLLDDDYKIWNAKSNLKSRWHGSAEYYHQDFSYWKEYGFKSTKMLSCMIFVDDHNHLNGGLWIFPGTHKNVYKHKKFININSLQKNLIPTETLDKLEKKQKSISLNSKSGSCIFFHCKLIHGSSHNISSKNRRIILYQISNSKEYDEKLITKINIQNVKERKKFEKNQLLKRLSKFNEN